MSRSATPRSATPEPALREDSRLLDNGARQNIKVSVRIRPLSDKESTRGDRAVWGTDGSGGVGLLSAAGSKLDVKFAYDVVFSASNTNEQVFDDVAWPAIEPVLQGISGTVFAYGVTSSGKTHTMMGTPSDAGVVPRAIRALFDRIDKSEDCVYSVKMSMMEIYCEMLNDLLDSSKLNLDVQECNSGAGKGSVLVVKGLTEGKVASAEEALALIQQGQENRKVASTAFNDQSSRSHTICRFLVESTPKRSSASALHTASGQGADSTSSRRGSVTGVPGGSSSSFTAAGSSGSSVSCTSAWLTLVDLAGSEGAKAALSKDQQAEARDINRSLLTLGKVMYELAKGASAGHLPFRDSLLTRLLKPSLTGTGAKVAIICNVTPASSQSDETWNTLRFADGAKRIKITAVKNEALDVAAVVAQYQREVAALKAQLAALSGAAACAGGNLSTDVLHAIQATLDNSSKDNAADELKDQAAQLQYLRECLSFATAERDQLLIMNKQMTALLVQQVKQAAGAAASVQSASNSSSETGAAGAEAVSAAAGAGGGDLQDVEGCSSRGCAAGAAGVSTVRKRATRIRRCLSYESLEYYGQWQGSSPDGFQHEPHLQQQQQGMGQEPGLECNAADAEQVHQLLRLTSEDLPESITHSALFGNPAQQLQPQQQPPGPQEQQPGSQQQSTEEPTQLSQPTPAAVVVNTAAHAAAEAGVLSNPGSSTGNISLKSGLGPRVGSGASACSVTPGSTIPPMLSKYYSAVSSFGGLSSTTDHSGTSSFGGRLPSRPASAGTAAAGAAGAGQAGACPIVPCPIVFPGSRRTSKTLAAVMPGAGGTAGNAAGWLGCVGLPMLPEGVTKSALSEVVEAHKALAGQESRLQLLMQQLADKEALLEQARQLQQGEVLQLRLTITAADRALLRDKLAEAEQQIAGYQAQQVELEQEVIEYVQHLLAEKAVVEQERDAVKSELAQRSSTAAHQTSALATSETSAAAADLGGFMSSPAAISVRRSQSRGSSGCSSPEPGSGTRIPLPPGSSLSPVRSVVTVGGTPTPPISRIAASGRSLSRSLGSPPKKSAAAAATFINIKAAMASAGAAGSSAGSAPNSARSTGSATAAGGAGSSMSPRLSKIASGLPSLALDGVVGGVHAYTAAHLHSPNGSRHSGSPGASPRSISRGNSFLGRQGPSGADSAAAAGAGAPGSAGRALEPDSRIRANWGYSGEASLGGFDPICITSPFHQQAPAAAADARSPAGTVTQQRVSTEAAGRGSGSGAATGSSSLSSPRTQSLRSSAGDGNRRGSSTGAAGSNIGALQSAKQSRIPLPPFLKRHSKRLMQLQQEDGEPGSGRSSAGEDRSAAAAPALDRYLLGLHGPGSLPEVQEQQPSFPKTATAAAAAAAAGRPGSTEAAQAASCASSSGRAAGLQVQPAASQLGASPFAAAAAAAGVAAGGPLAEGCEGDEEPEGEAQLICSMTSVKSHPLELADSFVAGWSARSSEVCIN